jgi:hypothetical protein
MYPNGTVGLQRECYQVAFCEEKCGGPVGSPSLDLPLVSTERSLTCSSRESPIIGSDQHVDAVSSKIIKKPD